MGMIKQKPKVRRNPRTPTPASAMFSQSYLGYGLILSATFIMLRWLNERRRLPLPPGPRKFPFIGHLLAMPSEFPGHQFDKMGKELTGTSYIILNSLRVRG
ncbi:hypothetical protein MPER_04309, partial [Moniliophthora perniciosa FA553]